MGGSTSVSSSAATTSAGQPCGNATCNPATEYCGYAPGTCDGEKACHPFGVDCMDKSATCGCDGMNYEGACATLVAVGGIRANAACAPPAGKFNCTYQTQVPVLCDAATQYCLVTPGGGLYSLKCIDDPTCTTHDCTCPFTGHEGCAANYCAKDPATSGVTILCP